MEAVITLWPWIICIIIGSSSSCGNTSCRTESAERTCHLVMVMGVVFIGTLSSVCKCLSAFDDSGVAWSTRAPAYRAGPEPD